MPTRSVPARNLSAARQDARGLWMDMHALSPWF
jgi:hypothetical protein